MPAFGAGQLVAEILGSYGVFYKFDGDGHSLIDPEESVMPVVYGRGSDPRLPTDLLSCITFVIILLDPCYLIVRLCQ
jgi:hypothetical protein